MPLNDFKILVWESRPLVQARCLCYFRELGFEVLGSMEASLTWQLLETKGFDLLVLDLNEAGSDSLEWLTRFRRDFPSLKVLIMADLAKRLDLCFGNEKSSWSFASIQSDPGLDQIVCQMLGLPSEQLFTSEDHTHQI